VFIAEPPRTQFDLNFQVLGFPVRVHPFFWLVGVILGFGATYEQERGIQLMIWLVALFGSILVHELGHALMIRRLGREAHIVLYAMGGLAIEGRPSDSGFGNPWSFDSYTPYQPRPRSAEQQILISAAGPGIQFVLAGLVAAMVYATGGRLEPAWHGIIPFPEPVLGGSLAGNRNLDTLVFFLLQVNILWPIMNLLPVLPLDGGQIALQVLTQQDPWGGMQRALWLSVITGGVMAALGLLAMRDVYLFMLFASLAASSYMTLQQQGGGRRPW
jgi:stage IV sporulation protein FB